MSLPNPPEGFHSLTPYLMIEGAQALAEFISLAFGARELNVMRGPDGVIANAKFLIGDSVLMFSEATPGFNLPGSCYVYVSDVDETYLQSLKAGAESLTPPADRFYGDRTAGVRDPSGSCWWIATKVEQLSNEEIAARAARQGQAPG